MSLSSARKSLTLLALCGLLVLAACSGLRPLYGAGGVTPGRFAFHYTDPGNRLDQLIYAELRLRLGPDTIGPDALTVTVSTSAGARALTRTGTAKVAAADSMIVTTTFTVTDAKNAVVVTGTRSTEALYQTTGQVLADTEAANDASERGARALADTVRLAILGALATAK